MNLRRALSLALAAFLLSAAISCGGEGGTPTSPDTRAAPGDPSSANGTQLSLAGGGNQTGTIGHALSNPISVRVLDGSSRPVWGATINFIAKDGAADPTQASTDAEGYARTTWTLGPAAGTQELRVSGTGGTTLAISAVAIPPARAARVQVMPDSVVLTHGATAHLSAVAYDSTGAVLTGRGIHWTSSDSVTARVDSAGTVTAGSPGAANLTATVEGISGSARVFVPAPPRAAVARVRLEPDSLVLLTGQSGDFDAVAYDSAGAPLTGRAVTWTSSDSAVVRLSSEGGVTALSAGTAVVSATVEGVAGTARVIVSSPVAPVARVAVAPDSVVLQPGHSAGLSATAYDAAGHVLTGRAISWASSDPDVARVSSEGAVTAVAAGAAVVSASVEGVAGSARVIVSSPAATVARVTVAPDSVVLQPGHSADLGATAFDAAGHVLTGRAITWASSDSTLARVGSSGVVTAVAEGAVQITATVDGVSGSARVSVVAAPPTAVARVVVSPDSVTLEPGTIAGFQATAYDGEGHVLTGRAITWASSDSTVARVEMSGVVRAVAAGTARLTATVEGVSGGASIVVAAAPPPAAVARVEVAPDSMGLQVGQSAELHATAYDAGGHVLTGRAVTWTTADSTVARAGARGTVTAVAPGATQVTATVEGIGGVARVVVAAPPPPPPPEAVARVEVVPDSLLLYRGASTPRDLDAVAYDAAGHALSGRTVSWKTSDSTVVTVDAGGLVRAVTPGRVTITATVEGVSGTAIVVVQGIDPPITRVEVLPESLTVVVGQTGDFDAFAYDATNHIQTGRDVTWSASDSSVVALGPYGNITALAVGTSRITGYVDGVSGTAVVHVIAQPVGHATAPTNTTPDLRAGLDYVCRLRAGVVQCFGSTQYGQPAGEHRAAAGEFVQLSAGNTHACALRSDGVVECFGDNDHGEAPAQRRASSGTFSQVSAGLDHSCALRNDGVIECWGNNGNGEALPLWRAASGRFVVVTAYANRTCALRDDGVGECRGFHFGSPNIQILPGGWYVKLGTAVGSTICLERDSSLAECWGGQPNLGSGPFLELTAGASHECVLHTDGTALCGGSAYYWQGPDERSITDRHWARLTAGASHTCGLRGDGYFECFGFQTIGSDAPDVIPSADTPASALSGGSVRVTWRDINSNELRTEIDRSVADDAGNPTTWSRAGVLAANQTGFSDGLATPGGIYVYRIRVCNNAGCSEWRQSNPTRNPAGSPPSPTSVAASGYVCGYESCGRVTWSQEVAYVDSFTVQRRAMVGSAWGEWVTVTRLPRERIQFDDFAIRAGSTYQYRVSACNVRACSDYGTSDAFVAPLVPPPAAPADLVAAMMNAYMVHIVWGDVATETGYELQRREFAGSDWGAWSAPVGRAMNDTRDEQVVVSGTLYQWRVRACNQGGCSAYTESAPVRASW